MTPAERDEMQRAALARARNCSSAANVIAVTGAFAARGIPESEILPGENVLTFHAWRALGRTVRRGEHGVRVNVVIQTEGKQDAATGEAEPGRKLLRSAHVFHISQTEALS